MAKECVVCGKGVQSGHKVSHSNIKTNKKWLPNLQKIKIVLEGKQQRAYVCTRCLKAGKVQRAI